MHIQIHVLAHLTRSALSQTYEPADSPCGVEGLSFFHLGVPSVVSFGGEARLRDESEICWAGASIRWAELASAAAASRSSLKLFAYWATIELIEYSLTMAEWIRSRTQEKYCYLDPNGY